MGRSGRSDSSCRLPSSGWRQQESLCSCLVPRMNGTSEMPWGLRRCPREGTACADSVPRGRGNGGQTYLLRRSAPGSSEEHKSQPSNCPLQLSRHAVPGEAGVTAPRSLTKLRPSIRCLTVLVSSISLSLCFSVQGVFVLVSFTPLDLICCL